MTFEVRIDTYEYSTRYGWERLQVGDVMIVSGRFSQPLNAQNAASRYAAKHGWKLKTERIGGQRAVRVTRIA